tara:strand:+ start:682 stop:906 length:225 start_codon:yes stop_codon:yes gene_type:complete
MAVKNGTPKMGQRNARPITRVENELTGIPRTVSMYTERASGDVKFLNNYGKTYWFETKAKKAKAIKQLNKFWNA